MGLEALKKTRFIFPGIILLVYAFIVLNDAFPDKNPLDNYSWYVLAIALAFIYHLFKLREILWGPIREFIINTNICYGVEAIKRNEYVKNIAVDLDVVSAFKTGLELNKTNDGKRRIERALDEFFDAVGIDDRLKTKSKMVMMNGALLTCCIDSAICGVVVVVLCLVSGRSNFCACFISIVSMAAMAFIPALVEEHVKYSDEQLCIINNSGLLRKND